MTTLRQPTSVMAAVRTGSATVRGTASSPGRSSALTLLCIAYAWVLHYAYSVLISPVFTYLAQTYRKPTFAGVVLSVGAVILIALNLPSHVRQVSDFILWMLFIVAVAPSILISQYADVLTPRAAAWSAIAMLATYLVVIRAARALRFSRGIHLPTSVGILKSCALSFTVVFTVALVFVVGASFSLVGLTDVKDLRSTYKAAMEDIPVMAYAIQFQTSCLNPVFMCFGALRRRYLYLILGVVGQVLIYSVTGYKLTILSPIFVIGLALYLKHRKTASNVFFVSAITTSMLASIALDTITGTGFMVQIFINRLVAIPGLLTSAFLMVFADLPKYHWSHSFLSFFTTAPFDVPPGYLVGRVFQNSDANANANFIADGFANWGWPGVAVEACFLVLILAVLDATSQDLPIEFTAPCALVAAFGLANNSAFTSVLTGGFGGLMVIFALWPRKAGPLSGELSASSPPR